MLSGKTQLGVKFNDEVHTIIGKLITRTKKKTKQ